MLKIISVVGTRPNFIKIAALIREINIRPEAGLHFRLVHTGQHYDQKLSKIFFEELQITSHSKGTPLGTETHD